MIADIGGYTRFMRLHRLSLAHAQDVTGRLLGAVIDAVPQLELVEIEGDAGFFYRPGGGPDVAIDLALAMHRAFHEKQARLVALNMCNCEGCVQAGELKMKVVAHVGEVANQTIGRRTNLVGVDVIAVHRMLKNEVPVSEYVLMSEPVWAGTDDHLKGHARGLEQELEGLGPMQLYWLDIDELPARVAAPPPRPAIPSRILGTMGVVLRGFPYLVGIRRPRYALDSQER
jgi:hypothetical protein